MTEKPLEKYPVDYKCVHIYAISDKMKEYGMNIGNLQPNVPTKNSYHDFNLHDFINDKIQHDNTIYPKLSIDDVYPTHYDITERGSVVLIPKHYDSSNDDAIHTEKTKKGRQSLIDMYKKLYIGKKLDEMVDMIDKYVDFGRGNYEWANIGLNFIYEHYKEHFVNGYLRVWMPFDWDSSAEFDSNDNPEFGYPENKMLHLSDIEEYLRTNYGLEDEDFYRFVIKNNYIEGRYWEKPLSLNLTEDKKFSRINGKYGMDATENISKMLGIMEIEFKDLIEKCFTDGYEYFPIYVDYYKEFDLETL